MVRYMTEENSYPLKIDGLVDVGEGIHSSVYTVLFYSFHDLTLQEPLLLTNGLSPPANTSQSFFNTSCATHKKLSRSATCLCHSFDVQNLLRIERNSCTSGYDCQLQIRGCRSRTHHPLYPHLAQTGTPHPHTTDLRFLQPPLSCLFLPIPRLALTRSGSVVTA